MKQSLCFVLCIFLISVSGFSYGQNWLWAKSGNGTGGDEGWSVCTDANGNVIETGYFYSPTITFGSIILTNSGGSNVFVVKYDANGNVLWAKKANGISWDAAYSVSTDAIGNIFVTGGFSSPTITFGSVTLTNTGGWDVFTVKYDANGNVQWAISAIGTGHEASYSVSADASGNVFITGYFYSPTITFGSFILNNADPSGNTFDIFIAKYDSNGNILWAKSAGGINDDESYSLSADAGGNIFVTGYFSSPNITFGLTTLTNAGNNDLFIAKYDANGNVIWAKGAGFTGDDQGYSVSADPVGNVFVTGYFQSTTIAFGSTTLTNAGVYDVFIAKYDANGNVIWAKAAGGINDDEGYSVSADASGNVYIAGYFQSPTITFGTITLTPSVNPVDQMFIVKYDANGNVICASALDSRSDDNDAVSSDLFGNAYLGGDFSANPFIVGKDTLPLTGQENIFVAKWICGCSNSTATITGIPNICSGKGATLTANPSGAIYSWSNGSTSNAILVNPTSTSTYSVIVSIGNCSDTANIIVNVLLSPAPTIIGENIICSGNADTLNASGGNSYVWNTGATTQTIAVTPSTTTTYSLTATNNNGCNTDKIFTITVNPTPIATISGNTNLCSGQTATLNSSGGGTYSWSNGSTNNSISISPSTTTNYSVTVTNTNGCSDTANANVIVTPMPTATASPNSTICSGTTETLIASGGSTYLWNAGQTTTAIIVAPNANTNYSVTVANGNCKDTAFLSVTVNSYPVPITSGNITIFQGETTTLTANGGTTYLWNNGETTTSVIVAPATTTKYCVTVADANNCKDSTCLTVSIESPCDTAGTFFFPNAFSPNGDGENDVLKIYYNETSCIQTLHLIIYDRWGEKVYETNNPNFQWDGRYNGNILNTQVLVCSLSVKFTDGKEINRKRNVSLVR